MKKFTNITELWNKTHPHLVPDEGCLKNGYVNLATCPKCQGNRLVAVVSKIKTETSEKNLPTYYCGDCSSYYLESGDGEEMVHESEKVISVDARLWSSAPTFLNLEPTTRCNFECWYCVGRHMEQADITISRFTDILDRFPGLKTLALVGEGEPLMHKQFFEMVRIARDRGITVGTISNGSTFSRSNIKKLCESGINYISVSIDSIDPTQFSSSRIGGDLKKVLINIKNLVEYRQEIGAKYPKIGLKGTLFRETIDELPKIVDLAKAYGVEIFEGFQALNPMRTYIPIYEQGKIQKLAEIAEVAVRIREDTQYAITQLKPIHEFAAEEGIEIDNNGTANGIRPGCDEQWVYSLLSGDVTPCCQIKVPQNENWNLSRHSIQDIMSDPDYEKLRFNLWNGLFPEMCKGCWKTNTGATIVQNVIGNSDGSLYLAHRSKTQGALASHLIKFFRR